MDLSESSQKHRKTILLVNKWPVSATNHSGHRYVLEYDITCSAKTGNKETCPRNAAQHSDHTLGSTEAKDIGLEPIALEPRNPQRIQT